MDPEYWFDEAAKVARKATCRNGRCGCVIVKNDVVIGRGFNGPPLGRESNRTCNREYVSSRKPRFDQTCCVHAEWRAIFDALRRNPGKLRGSRLYFVRVGDRGEKVRAGKPYCTVCSRLTMEAGVAEFALWQEGGTAVWPLDDYDRVSYDFFSQNEE